jgi:hypothetical protein
MVPLNRRNPMALKMSYSKVVNFQTTPLVYPNSYWVPVFNDLNKVAGSATITFQGYADEATRQSGKAVPIASHKFTVTGTTFATFFGTQALTTSNLYAQAYAMAKVTPDPIPPYVKGAKPTIFFATAVEV